MKPTSFLLTLLLIMGLLPGCRKGLNRKARCAEIRCFAYLQTFGFRPVDVQTGAPLPASTLRLSDLSLFHDAALRYPILLAVDSSKADAFFRTSLASDTMYLQVKGSRVHRLAAKFRETDCCSAEVQELKMDGKTICTGCPTVIPLPLTP